MTHNPYFIGPEAIRREMEKMINDEGEVGDYIDSEASEEENAVMPNDDDIPDEFDVRPDENEAGFEMGETITVQSAENEVDRNFVLGKDLNTIWTDQPLAEHSRCRIPGWNIASIAHLPGAKGRGKTASSELEIFALFVDDEMIDIIVQCTNEEIERKTGKYLTSQRYIGSTDNVEVRALVGMLIMGGVLKDSNLNLEDLFSHAFGIPLFRATMPQVRFKFLLSMLRFDSKRTRKERRAVDVFALFREIWERFVGNCKVNYTPSEYVTIDETLWSFRGSCSFKMNIPNEPGQCGLKIVSMCDARTFYFCDGIPYVGKTTPTENSSLGKPAQYVMKLADQIVDTSRNITMDNWFTSYELAEALAQKKLTLVGALRKNKKEIPPGFVDVKGIPLKSSRFLYQPDKMIVSYNRKKNKNLIILSTMHDTGKVNTETGKSDIVEFYNFTKGGVDIFNKLCQTFTTKRACRRWPMRYFFGLLDAAAVNTYVVYSLKPNEISRSSFLKSLALSLTAPHMRRRLDIQNLPRSLRSKMCTILGVDEDTVRTFAVARPGVRGRCAYCKDRKTKYSCDKCAKYLCLEHAKFVCEPCLDQPATRECGSDEDMS